MGDYVITKDISRFLVNRKGLVLPEEDLRELDSLEDAFAKDFESALGRPIVYIKDIGGPVTPPSKRISLDNVHFKGNEHEVQVTRTVRPFELSAPPEELPRPGYSSINDQIRALPSGEYTVCDVGIFSGDTLLKVCNAIESRGDIVIEDLWVGLTGKKAHDSGKIYCKRSGRERKISFPEGRIFDFEDGGDWLEMRDLLGFDGRTILSDNPNYHFSCYSTNLGKHASIPEDCCGTILEICTGYFDRVLDLLKRSHCVSVEDTLVSPRLNETGKKSDFLVRRILFDPKKK
jgi:hypothetical protein